MVFGIGCNKLDFFVITPYFSLSTLLKIFVSCNNKKIGCVEGTLLCKALE